MLHSLSRDSFFQAKQLKTLCFYAASVSISLLCFTCFFSQFSEAAPTAAEIEAAVKEAKEVPEDKKFSARVSGSDAWISTFSSSDVDNDHKIEAVLFARAITKKFPEIIRVTTDFHQEEGSASKYKQVTVTKPELVAFGTGSVSSSELLSAIRIEEKYSRLTSQSQQAAQPIKAASEKAENKEADSSKAAEAYKAALKKGENPEAKWETYHAPGLAFDYPLVWRKSTELEGDTIVRFKSSQTTYEEASLALKLYKSAKKTPVIEEARQHAESHQRHRGFKIIKPSSIVTIGKAKNIKAVCENYAQRENHKTTYQRNVYFGWPGYVYRLGMSASASDYAHVNNLFEHLLASVRLESASK